MILSRLHALQLAGGVNRSLVNYLLTMATQNSLLRRVSSNITIEPLVICWLLPFLLTYAAIENLNIEKACRGFVEPSSGFGKDICRIFVRKDSLGIDCNGNIELDEVERKFPEIYNEISANVTSALDFLCVTEAKVQRKLSAINSIRNPIASIGPLIIILFAGPWSDQKNLRVPCMVVPLLGEALGYLCEPIYNSKQVYIV